jgi:adenosine deaminase CECR1
MHWRGLAHAALLLCLTIGQAVGASFEQQFELIKRQGGPRQLYTFLFDLPKGGDLHLHFGLSTPPAQLFAAATDPARSHGNEFYTRTKFNNCDSGEPLLRFRTIQRATYRALSDCAKGEYENLAALSPKLRDEWISAMRLGREGEGRNEFFEVIVPRLTDMSRDPWLATELLIQSMKRYAAQGIRYIEPQTSACNFTDHDGKPMDEDRCVQLFRDALNRPDAKATGVTVRFLATVIRFAPNAEQQIERAYAFVDRHRELWVGVNMAGREDNDKGYARRFLETFRKMRRTYSGIQLSLHGGEVDSPGQDVRQTLMLGATRIGHGVNLITDPDTMLLMQSRRYMVETSLISNRLLEYVPDPSAHPFIEYLRFGIPVSLNTDDPGVWDSNLTDEYYTAVTSLHLTWREIVEIGRDSLRYSFAEPAVKQRMLKEYEEAVERFEEKYGGDDWALKLAKVRPDYSGYATRNFGL